MVSRGELRGRFVILERGNTDIRPVRRLSSLFIILSHFVKIVFVELAHKAGEVAVLEMLRQDRLGKLLALYRDQSGFFVLARSKKEQCGWRINSYLENDETIVVVTPAHDVSIRWILQHSVIR